MQNISNTTTVNACIIRNDQEILLVKRVSNDAFDGFWSLPGGTLEDNESIDACLHREIEEELRVSINHESFFASYAYPLNDSNQVMAYYFTGNIYENITINPEEISDFCWVDILSPEIENYTLAFNQNQVVKDLAKDISIKKSNHYTLRISVTSLCNLYCTYCNPDRTVNIKNMISTKEILDIGEIVSMYGVKKISYTGGEPTMRKDIVEIVAGMKRRWIVSQSMTTNGIIFYTIAEKLKDAGLTKVNISLDTLKKQRYKDICGYDGLENVIKSIKQALRIFWTVKVNCVLTKDNFDELQDFIDFVSSFSEWECILRFLEVVPYDKVEATEWNYVSYSDIYSALEIIGIEKEVTQEYIKDVPKTRYFKLKWKRWVYSINPCASVDYACDKDRCTKLRLNPNGYLSNCTTQLRFARKLKWLTYREKHSIIRDIIYEKIKRKYIWFQHKGKYYDFWRFWLKNNAIDKILLFTKKKQDNFLLHNK